VRIRYIDDVLLLIITNFVVWSWALEKHPEPETNPVYCNLFNQRSTK